MNRDKLYSVANLCSRGWTKTAMERFLPSIPDDTRDHLRRSLRVWKSWHDR